jgi:radical SAM protein with 4Fe4S-binding SPASM domain
LGALWCGLTGGEPLLRKDFSDIYLYLKKKGLLVGILTNATLISESHIRLFKKYPPSNIEITVYGITKETYEAVTRTPGSFLAFMRGFHLLIKNGIKVRLKFMALRSNLHEFPQIVRFCRQHTKDFFRFDPFLNLRVDQDPQRNQDIISQRLSPEEIVALESTDTKRIQGLRKVCRNSANPQVLYPKRNHLFRCGIGNGSFAVSYDGIFRPCLSLRHPDCIYDLKRGGVCDAWNNFIPEVKDMRSDRKNFLDNCRKCQLLTLCMWCPAHAYLETGRLDQPVDYFCEIAQARAKMLQKSLARDKSPLLIER